MTERFRLTLGQMAPRPGDLAGNAALARKAWAEGKEAGAQLVALPEMFLSGNCGAGLLGKPAFLRDLRAQLDGLAQDCAEGPALALGAPWEEAGRTYNAYVILEGGRVTQRVLKHGLTPEETAGPLTAAPISGPIVVAGLRIGCPIGQEAAQPDVAETLEETGAELLLVPDAAAYASGAMDRRLNHMVARVVETGLPLVHLNRSGASGETVFDGASTALNPGGALASRLPAFDGEVAHLDLQRGAEGWQVARGAIAAQPVPEEQDYRALVESLRAYFAAGEGAPALVDLGAGPWAALVATLAADALGPSALRGVLLPGQEEVVGAEELARGLGIAAQVIPLSQVQAALSATLAPLQRTEDAAQAEAALRDFMRARLAAAHGALVLSAGTRIERALRPTPDCADIAPLGDLYPSQLTALVRWRNAHHRPWMKGPAGAVMPEAAAPAIPEAMDEAEAVLRILLDRNGSLADCKAAGLAPARAAAIAARLHRRPAGQQPFAPRLNPASTGPAESFWQDPG